MRFKSIAFGLVTAGLAAGLWTLPGVAVSTADAGPRYRDTPRKERIVRKHRRAPRLRRLPPAHRVYRHPGPRGPYRSIRRAPRACADVIWIDGHPARYHAGLRIYIGGLGLQFQVDRRAPRGYLYEDPYCDLRFHEVDVYRRHARDRGHRAVLDLVEDPRYDDGY